jgi:sigma-B regulation protein RsbU (phosphoserine phosphatase)
LTRLFTFQFRSVTHRLVCACIVSAVLIYGLSFSLIRDLLEQTVKGWITQLAQSRLEAVAGQLEADLQASAAAGLEALGSDPDGQQLQSLLHQPFAKSPPVPIQAVLLARFKALDARAAAESISPLQQLAGASRQSSGAVQAMEQTAALALLRECKPEGMAGNKDSKEEDQTGPYRPYWRNTEGEGHGAGLVYCVPRLASPPAGGAVGNRQLLAIRISLDQALDELQRKLQVTDTLSHLEMGQAFVMTPRQRWLLRPPDSLLLDTVAAVPNGSPSVRQSADGILAVKRLQGLPFSVGMVFPQAQINQVLRQYLFVVVVSMLKDMLLMCAAIALVSRHTTSVLRALIKSTEEIEHGNLQASLPEVSRKDEVGSLSRAFRRMRDALSIHIRDLKLTTAANQRMESELSIAAQIQQAMLPGSGPATDDAGTDSRYRVAALLQPARQVGGDLYDFFALDQDRLCLLIGDVAGKGVPAALFMARTLSITRTLARHTRTPSGLLSMVNMELSQNNPECMFVTVFFAILDLRSGQMLYASAGHDAPLLLRQGEVSPLKLETGPAIGLDQDSSYSQFSCQLLENDMLLCFTDGITEAGNPAGEHFSEQRLRDLVCGARPASPAHAITLIQAACHQHAAGAAQSDDLTLLAMQYQTSPSASARRKPAPAEWEISLNSEPVSLHLLKQEISAYLQEKKLGMDVIQDMQLMAEEALLNITRYGTTDQPVPRIELHLSFDEGLVKLLIEDDSHPFDALKGIIIPDLSEDIADRPVGGLGLYLVSKIADQMDYDYRDGKNRLQLCKKVAHGQAVH